MSREVVDEGDDTAAAGYLRELVALLGAKRRSSREPVMVELPVSLVISYEPASGWTARTRPGPPADWREAMDERHRVLWENIGRLRQIAAMLSPSR